MFERLVENWLTSVGEIGYQTPFAQLLVAEGHRVLQGPVHHPFEHGKDIITFDPEGRLCAYQLKGPNEISDLKGLERYQGQLEALAMAAISHPAVGKPRLADRVFAVTNGELRPEVRDRLSLISAGNVARGLPPLDYIERDHLVTRLIAAHGKYLPSDPPSFRRLVELYSASGEDVLALPDLMGFLQSVLPVVGVGPSEALRALTSMTLFTAYALRGAQASENHLALAQGWMATCLLILRFAETSGLEDDKWESTFELAFQAARRSSHQLLLEAADRDDLVEPHLAEGAFYGTRALLVLGWSAAHFLSERRLGADGDIWEPCKRLLRRERRYVKVHGESGAPYLFAIANALSILDSAVVGEGMVIGYTAGLLFRNRTASPDPLPDPYHTVTATLAHHLGLESEGIDPNERFDGHVYGAKAAIEWLVRRLRRQAVASLWAAYTRITSCEFLPSLPSWWLAQGDKNGTLEMRLPKAPESWAGLRTEALLIDPTVFPKKLWSRAYVIPYLGLVIPSRFTSALCRATDFFWFSSSDFVVASVPLGSGRTAKGLRGGSPRPRRRGRKK